MSAKRIQVAIDEERNVKLSQSEKGTPVKTKLGYKYKKWEKDSNCPFCYRPVTVVIDETHNGRNIYLKITF